MLFFPNLKVGFELFDVDVVEAEDEVGVDVHVAGVAFEEAEEDSFIVDLNRQRTKLVLNRL